MSWGKTDEVLGLIREEVRGRLQSEIVQAADDYGQTRLSFYLSPANRNAARTIMLALDAGTATQAQRDAVLARILHVLLREP